MKVMRQIICWAALVVMTVPIAFAQNPTSGALLEIDGTVTNGASNANVHLKVYDSQIHTGVVQVPALPGSGSNSNCGAGDEIPTDAYVLQAEAPTGCDPGDLAEGNLTATGSFTFQSSSAPAYEFDISTQYVCGPNEGFCSGSAKSNTNGNISSNDSGFLTITNNASTGSTFTGTIKLSGTSANCGALSDSVSGLGVGASAVLALSADSSSCGGFDGPQTQTLTQGGTSTFIFGNESYNITPTFGGTGDTLTFRPVPVPAGPLSGGSYGTGGGVETPVSSPLRFGSTNFPGQECIAMKDFSGTDPANPNPVCPELEFKCFGAPGQTLDGGDCLTVIYSSQYDFTKDTSLSGGIGGVGFIKKPQSTCPPVPDFTQSAFVFYTATSPDPIGGGGHSLNCYAGTFDPTAAPVAVGQTETQKTFVGFQAPVADCTSIPCVPNVIKVGQSVPLKWQSFSDSAGTVPITDLHVCTDVTTNSCTGHWVFIGTAAINCATDSASTNPIMSDTSGGSGLQFDPTTNTYTFSWKTPSNGTGCVSTVMGFFTGQWFTDQTLGAGADFKFKH